MNQPHGYRAIMRPRLLDAEVFEVLGKVRRARRSQELGHGELEGVGEFL